MAISRKGRLTCIHGQNTCPRRLTAAPAKCPHGQRKPLQLARPRWLTAAPAKCQHGLRAAPAHSPARAPRREIPRGRNVNIRTRAKYLFCGGIEHNRTRIIKTRVHPYCLVIARSAKRDAAISRKGRRKWRPRTLYLYRGRNEHKRTRTVCLYRGGFLRCVRSVVLTPVEMTS